MPIMEELPTPDFQLFDCQIKLLIHHPHLALQLAQQTQGEAPLALCQFVAHVQCIPVNLWPGELMSPLDPQ